MCQEKSLRPKEKVKAIMESEVRRGQDVDEGQIYLFRFKIQH
jgi:hypothetical protein